MLLSVAFFYLFAALIFICSLLSIFSKNTIHSILYLILVFCNGSGLLLLYNVDYIAMVYVVVYIGAIAVLFLFVVMMLNIKLLELNDNFWQYAPIGIIISLLILSELLISLTTAFYSSLSDSYSSNNALGWVDALSTVDHVNLNYTEWFSTIISSDLIQNIGSIMYTYYFFGFILSSFILLVAMIGSISLTLKSELTPRRQNLFNQISRNFDSAIRVEKKTF